MFYVFYLIVLTFYSVLAVHKIPEDFEIGYATASYQIEGGWNEDGKGENIWDRLVHTTNLIEDNSTGDIAADSYHKYKEDVEMLTKLNASYYRFSLSWSRILPNGSSNIINEAGIKYYRNLLTELKANGIDAMVTLYHWDLPQPLQDIGGWPNPLIEEYYADYVTICFERFGDLVKKWSTFNEPMQVCQGGYGSGSKAPAIESSAYGQYLCAHTLIKSHARAYHIYDKKFRAFQGGEISIVTDFNWFEPKNASSKIDTEAAERGKWFTYGWFINPIVYGNYPKVMIDLIEKKSQAQGYPRSRLPVFSRTEQKYIKGTYDFIGVNSYSTTLTTIANNSAANFYADMNIAISFDPSWPSTGFPFFTIVPGSMRKLLVWIKNNFLDPELYVTESGMSDDGRLNDKQRISYYQEYISSALDARVIDKVKLRGYTAWSLMDNFEWYSGYTIKFGIYSVDFNSPERTRTPKKSAEYMRNITLTRCLVDNCND